MDLKKPGFGGPNSAKEYRDGRGNIANPKPKLKDYQRVVERDPLFSHPHYNSTYKAMTHDVVYKQAKKKPFDYKELIKAIGELLNQPRKNAGIKNKKNERRG